MAEKKDPKKKSGEAHPQPPAPAVAPPPKAPAHAEPPRLSGAKTDTRATRTVESDAEQLVKARIEKQVARPGVIKTPTFESPKEVQPTPPLPAMEPSAPPNGPTAVPPATPAAPMTAAAPPATAAAASPALVPPTPAPAPASPALVAGGKAPPSPSKEIQLPAWYTPDPNDPFPLTEDDLKIDFYPIAEPYAYILITYNQRDRENVYRVIEPRLTEEEKKVLKFVEHTMVDLIDVDPKELDEETPKAFLKKKFEEMLYDYSIVLGDDEKAEEASKAKLLYYLYRDFIGEGRIDCMMRDDLIEDISCDGAHQPIFLYHRKYEHTKSTVKFADDAELDSFVIRMAQRAGKHVSIAEPILDATMRDGSRLQATLAREVSSHGSTFTIRKFRTEPFTPPDLVRFGTMSPEILAYWWIAIQHGASAIYAGGTASGKTTGLNAILLFIPPQMKIVSIEDTREINLPHPNWIAGITRGGFGPRDKEGRQTGEIDMFQLLKNALRQRPEYIVVGEVRGKEAYNLFQAMATGHAAYGTMHADSVDAVIHRLESDPINIPRSLLEALDIVSIQFQTRVGGKRVRRTRQLSEIVGIDPHTREILTNEVFRWQPKDDTFKFSGVSYVLERIQVEKGLTPQQMKAEMDNRIEMIRYFIAQNLRNFRDVASVVTAYYKDPAATMEKVRKNEPWH